MAKVKKENSLVRHFSPAWFAASMGTGGLADLFYQLGNNSYVLRIISVVFAVINLIMFVGFLIPWVLRWFLHLDKLKEDMKHPIMSNFFVTMPVSGIILATNFLFIGQYFFNTSFIVTLSLILWIFGIVTTFILSVYVTFNMMNSEEMSPEFANFSWFITPVASIVVPMLGNHLVGFYLHEQLINLANFINIMDLSFFGIGFVLFIILSGIVLNRFIFHKMPHIMMLPTFWIILGPIGVATVSLFGLVDVNVALGYIVDGSILKMFGIIFWGFGFWAFGLVLLITYKYTIKGKVPFTLSWWAFIFPLVAYTMSGLVIYNYTGSRFVYIYTILLMALLVSLWLMTAGKTLIGIFNKKLFLPPKQNKQNNVVENIIEE